MFDWLYFWNLIWSFFMLLSLVFVPVFIVMIYFITRAPRSARPTSVPGFSVPRTSVRRTSLPPTSVGENQRNRAA